MSITGSAKVKVRGLCMNRKFYHFHRWNICLIFFVEYIFLGLACHLFPAHSYQRTEGDQNYNIIYTSFSYTIFNRRHLVIRMQCLLISICIGVVNLPDDIWIWVFSRILTRTCDLFKTGFNEEMSKCSELN